MKLSLAVFFAGAVAAATAQMDIPSTAIANGSFDTLVTALDAANLVDFLSEPNGPYTVFAPTDKAFAKLPTELVSCLLKPEKRDALTAILTYHVTDVGAVLSTDLSDNMPVPTLNDVEDPLIINLSEDSEDSDETAVLINESTDFPAQVVLPDVPASNGVIHAIDSVLVPPSVDVPAFLSTCQEEAAAEAAAAANQQHGVMCHYMGQSRSSGQWLTGPTHTCKCGSYGYWHSCYKNPASHQQQQESTTSSMATVEDLVIESDQLQMLTNAIVAAGLDGVLDGEGPFTVFAPSDRAFEKVPKKLMNALEANPDILKEVLLYHVVGGKAAAGDLVDGQIIETAATDEDDEIVVEKTCWSKDGNCDDGQYSIVLDDGSYVVAADVEADNGVIHVIDQVLIPTSLRGAVAEILAD